MLEAGPFHPSPHFQPAAPIPRPMILPASSSAAPLLFGATPTSLPSHSAWPLLFSFEPASAPSLPFRLPPAPQPYLSDQLNHSALPYSSPTDHFPLPAFPAASSKSSGPQFSIPSTPVLPPFRRIIPLLRSADSCPPRRNNQPGSFTTTPCQRRLLRWSGEVGRIRSRSFFWRQRPAKAVREARL